MITMFERMARSLRPWLVRPAAASGDYEAGEAHVDAHALGAGECRWSPSLGGLPRPANTMDFEDTQPVCVRPPLEAPWLGEPLAHWRPPVRPAAAQRTRIARLNSATGISPTSTMASDGNAASARRSSRAKL